MKTPTLILSSLVLLVASNADAQQWSQGQASIPSDDVGRWSFGGGIGSSLYYSGDYALQGLSSLGGVGSLSAGSGNNWFGVGLVEVSLSPTVRLGLNVTGHYSSIQGEDDPVGVAVPGDSSSGSIGGAVSMRWVLNPGDLVEVSPVVAVGTSWFHLEQTGNGWGTNADGFVTSRRDTINEGSSINARAGFTIEYRLLERLYLRLENYFLRVDRSAVQATVRMIDVDTPTTEQSQTASATSIGINVQPTLQLRIIL